jgi:hypothetical protein
MKLISYFIDFIEFPTNFRSLNSFEILLDKSNGKGETPLFTRATFGQPNPAGLAARVQNRGGRCSVVQGGGKPDARGQWGGGRDRLGMVGKWLGGLGVKRGSPVRALHGTGAQAKESHQWHAGEWVEELVVKPTSDGVVMWWSGRCCLAQAVAGGG